MKMGGQTDSGHWKNSYAVQFPFVTIDERQFFFGHNLNNDYWFIQELLPGGRMGKETDHGSWRNPYEVMFPFTIQGRTFCFGHSLETRRWFIQELLPGGKLAGSETSNGTWQYAYDVLIPYGVENRLFFFSRRVDSFKVFIQEILPDGQLGDVTDSGGWSNACSAAFPFKAGAHTYLFAHDTGQRRSQILPLLPGGKMGSVTDDQTWHGTYAALFPYNIGGDQYCYGQDLNSRYWFLQELPPGGRLGGQTQDGYWKFSYAVQFAFEMEGRQFFYGSATYNTGFIDEYHWFIQELLGKPDSLGAEELARKGYATVYVWPYRAEDAAVGHASMKISEANRNETYISWWPSNVDGDKMQRLSNTFEGPARKDQTYEKDIELENNHQPDVITVPGGDGFDGLNIPNIIRWWTKFSEDKNNKYSVLNQNCAATVKDALVAGGAWDILGKGDEFNDVIVWTPGLVKNFAGQIRNKIRPSQTSETAPPTTTTPTPPEATQPS
jgi:hypothetical protein